MAFGVEVPDPRQWAGVYGLWLAALHLLGIVYLVLFASYYVRLTTLRRKAATGDHHAVVRFNRSLHGFPNAFFAKQFGLHAMEYPKREG